MAGKRTGAGTEAASGCLKQEACPGAGTELGTGGVGVPPCGSHCLYEMTRLYNSHECTRPNPNSTLLW